MGIINDMINVNIPIFGSFTLDLRTASLCLDMGTKSLLEETIVIDSSMLRTPLTKTYCRLYKAGSLILFLTIKK